MAISSSNPVARSIYQRGRKRGETRKEILSALATGIVESHLQNLPGGNADSAGWRQERASLYPNPTNLIASINRYYDETSKIGNGRGISAGELSARVQRPAAQYRGRYRDVMGQAKQLFRSLGGQAGSTGQAVPQVNKLILPTMGTQAPAAQTEQAFNPYSTIAALNKFSEPAAGDPAQANYDLLANLYQAPITAQPNALTQTAQVPKLNSMSVNLGGTARDFIARATAVDKRHPSYLWGGGHGATPAKLGDNVDCSGYVSQILGVAPRVSGQFAKFGDAGPGRQVTIYANSGHVFIQIGNRFFGTSHSNPGGGAGEIARPPTSYLSQFTRRHPKGM